MHPVSPQAQLSPFKSIHQPSQRSRALKCHLYSTPPDHGFFFNSPWPSMSGAGKRNRVCERATPYTYLRHAGDSAPKAQAAQSLTSKSWVPSIYSMRATSRELIGRLHTCWWLHRRSRLDAARKVHASPAR